MVEAVRGAMRRLYKSQIASFSAIIILSLLLSWKHKNMHNQYLLKGTDITKTKGYNLDKLDVTSQAESVKIARRATVMQCALHVYKDLSLMNSITMYLNMYLLFFIPKQDLRGHSSSSSL